MLHEEGNYVIFVSGSARQNRSASNATQQRSNAATQRKQHSNAAQATQQRNACNAATQRKQRVLVILLSHTGRSLLKDEVAFYLHRFW